jgi:hypothetical protein
LEAAARITLRREALRTRAEQPNGLCLFPSFIQNGYSHLYNPCATALARCILTHKAYGDGSNLCKFALAYDARLKYEARLLMGVKVMAGVEIVISPVTAASISAAMPVSVKFRDMVARKAEIRICIQSEEFSRKRNWGRTVETGAKFYLTIKGKPGFCLAALQNLIGTGGAQAKIASPLEVFKAHVAEMSSWDFRTPLKDLVQPSDTIQLDITGPSHRSEHITLIRDYDIGPKCSISITGKPGFAQIAAAQLNLNAPFLQEMLTGIFRAGQ